MHVTDLQVTPHAFVITCVHIQSELFAAGPALGMFEVFGRTGPPMASFIKSDECNASVYVRS